MVSAAGWGLGGVRQAGRALGPALLGRYTEEGREENGHGEGCSFCLHHTGEAGLGDMKWVPAGSGPPEPQRP